MKIKDKSTEVKYMGSVNYYPKLKQLGSRIFSKTKVGVKTNCKLFNLIKNDKVEMEEKNKIKYHIKQVTAKRKILYRSTQKEITDKIEKASSWH